MYNVDRSLGGAITVSTVRGSNFNTDPKLALRELAIEILLDTIEDSGHFNIIGEEMKREGLLNTPNRVARMYEEIFSGYKEIPSDYLKTTFAIEDNPLTKDAFSEERQIVICDNINFFSHCEHHMVPFFGKITVAYIPRERVVGLSKIPRMVQSYCRRLQIQEKLGKQIADTMEEALDPLGVVVMIEAEHLCVSMRGIKQMGMKTVTTALRGVFIEDEKARNEFYQMLEVSRRN